MSCYSTTDHRSTQPASEIDVSQSNVSQLPRSDSGPEAPVTLAFPGDDRGQSLAEFAQRDLDAALQLLAERAQYITGATGAAIALRHEGEHDMLCRASSGLNAPELGALLSTEFGLSGESVRTRQPLRCDDAEHDGRVNREGCRELGIASVAVMPVLRDGEVLGVFELFSGKANAFEERDLSALQRLAEMVETAASFAQAATRFPGALVAEALLEEEIRNAADPAAGLRTEPATELVITGDRSEIKQSEPQNSVADLRPLVLEPQTVPGAKPSKPLLWSATLSLSTDGASAEPDQSHVPVALRSLRKCRACEFPVSEGRTLCVECEEKQWRGQPRVTPAAGREIVDTDRTPARQPDAVGVGANASLATESVVALAHSGIANDGAFARSEAGIGTGMEMDAANVSAARPELAGPELLERPTTDAAGPAGLEGKAEDLPFLSAALEPRQSWLATNKFILGAMLVVALGIAALAVMH